ncbi:MAG: MAPEG family protein [Caulobacteraceae bacterium]|nr:MAPEG family protein [Caulobacteraceae bacterium]
MNQNLIFAPMVAMALLTFAVLGIIPIRRFRAVFGGKITPDDFRLGESARVPAEVALPNRNYMNLLELPTLFFPVCLMFYVTGGVSLAALVLAWAYVALRAVHSVIHITYNGVTHRLVAFALSNVVLIALWGVFAAGVL